jgi:hypothetical protein
MNKTSILTLIALSLSAQACIIEASAPEIEERDVEAFHRIQTSGGDFELKIEHCDCTAMRIEGDPESVRTSVSGGTLTISGGGGSGWFDTTTIYLRTPYLSELALSGSADVEVRKLKEGSLKLTLSGSSDIKLSGQLELLDILSSGSADLDADELNAEHVNIVASGSSDMKVCAWESLSVISSGSSDIEYSCDPRVVNIQASGSSDIQAR